mgnify:CR=1 FL=1
MAPPASAWSPTPSARLRIAPRIEGQLPTQTVLMDQIREKRGLAYSVFSSLIAFRDAGCVSVYAGTATERAREVVRLIVEELHRLKDAPLSG